MSTTPQEEMQQAEALPQLDASSLVDAERLEAEVKDMYRHVAREEDAELHFEVGRGLAEHLGYPAEPAGLPSPPRPWRRSPAWATTSTSPALQPGEHVLDLGSGSGTDVFCAAVQVGDSGRVVGVDITDEQIATRPRGCGTATGSHRSSSSRRTSRSCPSRTRASTPSSRTG